MLLRQVYDRLLHPPLWVLLLVSIFAFPAQIYVLAASIPPGLPVYLIYGMSAYALTILVIAIPRLVRTIRTILSTSPILQRIACSGFGRQYLHDLTFRGKVRVYQGMIINFFYVVFRIAAGIRYASIWFLSMAAYYLVLGGLRGYLVFCFHRRTRVQEIRCYRKTAWLLFLLNIPMGVMILLMVVTNSGYSYPGHIIYLSALYTFYSMVSALINLVKYHRIGSPILSAAKVLNFVSAMMSILGLQTAMIARFSPEGAHFRRMMNAITGGCVYCAIIIIAIFMLLRSPKEKVNSLEQIRK